jgi:hypothetical protein
MVGTTPVLGVSLIAFGVLISAAEAKMVSYGIDGQRFSYSTKDPEQVAVFRQRMNAAKNAAAARAKAEAERAMYPFAGLFGSPTQNEATAADAQLHEALSNAPRSSQPSAPRETASESRTTSAHPKSQAVRPGKQAATSTSSVAATPGGARVEAIVFDFATGIRTVQMADGSVEEDLFDLAMVASVKRGNSSVGPRITFINEHIEAATLPANQ